MLGRYQIGVHVRTSAPIAFDFSRMPEFAGGQTIADVILVSAHSEDGTDITAQVFDAQKRQHTSHVVKTWVHHPPAGRHVLTCVVKTNDNQEVVWRDPNNELPYLVVNGDGAQPE